MQTSMKDCNQNSTTNNTVVIDFPRFDDLKVSTKTYTALPNFNINLEKLFDLIPITEYKIVPKKRGRKKKGYVADTNTNVPSGSFISVKFSNRLRGVDLKNNNTCMRNSMAMDIILDKRINFKIYCNGTFQLTGCKTYNHVVDCVKKIWDVIKDSTDVYTIPNGEKPEVIIVPAMRNIDFNLGFKVDREKMIQEKKNFSSFRCHLDVNCSYTGITLKIPFKNDIMTMETVVMTCENVSENSWTTKHDTYTNYIKKLPPKTQKEKIKKKRFNTFFIFYSGSTVMTGPCREFMRDDYNFFVTMMKENYECIVEKLDDEEYVSDGGLFDDDSDDIVL